MTRRLRAPERPRLDLCLTWAVAITGLVLLGVSPSSAQSSDVPAGEVLTPLDMAPPVTIPDFTASPEPTGQTKPDGASVAPVNSEPRIVWEVTQPFRLFVDPAITDRHRAAYQALDPAEREAPVLAIERRLAEASPQGWAADAVDRTCWDDAKMAHRPCGGADFHRPPSHRITALLEWPDPQDADIASAAETTDWPTETRGATAQTVGETNRAQPPDLLASIASRLEDLAPPPRCIWTMTPLSPTAAPDGARDIERATANSELAVVIREVDCETPVRFDVPFPAGATLSVLQSGATPLSTDVVVEDLFVLGLGDSFASGEGNPDVPVQFDDARHVIYGPAPDDDPLAGYPARAGAWTEVGDPVFLGLQAGWLSPRCHRSLYSHQARVALQLAIEHPHRAVTFVGLACAGAETTAGLFLQDAATPWLVDRPVHGQLSLAAQAQCAGGAAQERQFASVFGLEGRLPSLEQIRLLQCPRDAARRFDLILVSIGGNDIGFSRLVANAVLEDRSTLASLSGWMGQRHSARDAMARLPELALRYQALRRALHTLLHLPYGEADRVILTGYPPLAIRDEAGTVCPDGASGMDVYPAFHINSARVANGEQVGEALLNRMRAASEESGWRFVDAHRAQFVGRGICEAAQPSGDTTRAASSDPSEDLRLPRFVDGVWQPYAPSAYRPYASRQRWFRTPNDAYLTAHFHVAPSLVRNVLQMAQLNWFQLVLASTYSGAFHPTAEGQAAIADAAVREARAALANHGHRGFGGMKREEMAGHDPAPTEPDAVADGTAPIDAAADGRLRLPWVQ